MQKVLAGGMPACPPCRELTAKYGRTRNQHLGSPEVFVFFVRVRVTSWMICPSLWHQLASFLLRVGSRAARSPCLPRSRKLRFESQGSIHDFVCCRDAFLRLCPPAC